MFLKWNQFYIICGLIASSLISGGIEGYDNIASNSLCTDLICSCTNKTDEDSGLKYQEVDCKSKTLNETYFDKMYLSSYATKLDLNDNALAEVPNLSNNQLKILILSRNKIEVLYDQNFKHSIQLEELDLSKNEIHSISQNTFDQLKILTKLDLSHNRLVKINLMVFAHLPKLQDLSLSWNKNLNESKDLQSLDFFEFYGVTPFLKTLRFDGCNLDKLYLSQGSNLQNLYIASNNMDRMPELSRKIQFIDFSQNPIKNLNQTFATHLFHLTTLHLNDMPNLISINEYAFFGLPALKTIHLQNCKNLNHFDAHAFGESVVRNETDTVLEELNIRGSSLTTLNSALNFAFENLKVLNLDGSPLKCDCELKWLRTANFSVLGKCNQPDHLHMLDINKVEEFEFECDYPEHIKNIVKGSIIFAILLVCIALISIVVLGLRKKRTQRRHIGSGSPYARITIEPTCENRF